MLYLYMPAHGLNVRDLVPVGEGRGMLRKLYRVTGLSWMDWPTSNRYAEEEKKKAVL